MAPVSETFANLPSSFKQGWNEAIYPSPAQRAGMRERVEKAISDAEFVFSNSKVRVHAECDFQAIELPGLKIGPFSRGKRYTLPLWVAEELARKGIVRLVEEASLRPEELMTIHHREASLSKGLSPDVPDDFYPRLRRLLARAREEAERDPGKLQELNRLLNMARDVVNARLKKIVSLASSVARSPLTRKDLTPEEEAIFELVGDISDAWREEVLGHVGAGK